MNHKKKMNRRERIADYINQRMEGFSKVPNVLADRALKIGALSFLALFLGSYMGRQMDSASFIAWSVVMWLESDMRSICYGVGRKRNMRQSKERCMR